MKLSIHALLLATSIAQITLFACTSTPKAEAKATELKAPACYSQTESCRDAWYEYGDVTGDYGVIDAAE